MMATNELRDLFRLLYDVRVTCDLAMSLVWVKPEGAITREWVESLFDRFRPEMDEELTEHVVRYCSSVTTWPHDPDAEAIAAAAYDAITHSLHLAQAHLLQQGVDWREVRRSKIPTTNALF